ncbi:MAG: hypothetical protein GC131_02325 [Alphaproteobacteria bacterium]|nr:hypothetical protein [Alphaproteobacteria bacterium]
MHRAFLPALAAFFLLAFPAAAQIPDPLALVRGAAQAPNAVPPQGAQNAQSANYLAINDVPTRMLSVPAAKDSPAWKEQLAQVITAQKKLSEAERKAIEAEKDLDPAAAAAVLGRGFTREKLPKTFLLLDRLREDGNKIINGAKNFWKTERPFIASTDVTPLGGKPSNGAYPGGDAFQAIVWAETLNYLQPDKKEALRKWVDETAFRRVQAGQQFPADSEGGKELAMLVLGELWQSVAYRNDMAEAKFEMMQAGLIKEKRTAPQIPPRN